MNDDRKLLERAAKAAGVPIYASDDGTLQQRPIWAVKCGGGNGTMPYEQEWNPLRDDAEAFRLMATLNINVHFRENINGAFVVAEHTGIDFCPESLDGQHEWEATRRAIVRAAASIGEQT